ncbi:MAG: GntP family permease [Bacteroidetes bacterium]|nr:MAG: GntP family permease [Bacteroidota bacterium]
MLTGIPLLLLIAVAIAFIVLASARWHWHPFLALLTATLGLGLVVGLAPMQVIEAINQGFGGVLGYIGLIVVLGSMIGLILEKSGAALRIAQLILRLLGPKRPALAMAIIGAIVSIPVFCDSGFIILSGLNQALAKQTGKKRATLALALAAGLYTTHTLVPPTPGPIAAAGNLGATAHLGLIMLLGGALAIPTLLIAWWFARRTGAQIEVEELASTIAEQAALPSTLRALLPIVLPIVLIALAASLGFVGYAGPGAIWIAFLGHPLLALFLGLLAALALLPSWSSEYLSGWLAEGIALAGPILVITGAGGAFGGVLKATPLAALIESWLAGGQFAGGFFLLIAFLLAALLKTAQGSSTNALVITSSMLAPLLAAVGFTEPVELALIVMALGGGAMTVSHANDSYFWVVTRFSGIPLGAAYRSYTLMTGLQGITVLVGTLLVYWVLG